MINKKLLDKVIIITGASSGLGKELSFKLAKGQSKLVMVSRNLLELKKIKQELKKINPNIECFKCDVSNKNDCARIINKTLKTFGNIDYLIANAGVSMWNKFSKITNPDELKKIIEINYMGNVYLTFYLLRAMKKKNFKSKITYISSLQSSIGIPFHSGYTASKHALNGFSKVIALEEKNLTIQNVILAWVRGTNIRKNAFGNALIQKQKKNIPPKKILFFSKVINNLLKINVEECSTKIFKSLPLNKRKIFLPKVSFIIPILFYIFPNIVEKYIKRITHEEKKIGL